MQAVVMRQLEFIRERPLFGLDKTKFLQKPMNAHRSEGGRSKEKAEAH